MNRQKIKNVAKRIMQRVHAGDYDEDFFGSIAEISEIINGANPDKDSPLRGCAMDDVAILRKILTKKVVKALTKEQTYVETAALLNVLETLYTNGGEYALSKEILRSKKVRICKAYIPEFENFHGNFCDALKDIALLDE